MMKPLTRILAATLIAISLAIGGYTAASATAPAAAGYLQCVNALKSNGHVSLAGVAHRSGLGLAWYLSLQIKCPSAAYNGWWRPKFERYIELAHGNFWTLMPRGTPYFTELKCIDRYPCKNGAGS